jgi:hypothetical protein
VVSGQRVKHGALFNLAVCQEQRGDPTQVGELLAIVPEHDPANALYMGAADRRKEV